MDYKRWRKMEQIEKINALAAVLTSIKDVFIPDRNVKDEIVKISSDLLLLELKDLLLDFPNYQKALDSIHNNR
jgi:hypothetical protein